MPKSFRIGWVDKFLEEGQSVNCSEQQVLSGVPPEAETNIYPVGLNILTEDFAPFMIDHQFKLQRPARFDGKWVDSFITRGEISAYHSPSKKLLFLSGQRDVVDDFCKSFATSRHLCFSTVEVDMNALLKRIPEINLAWFRFPKGRVKASALMGRNIENTSEFRNATARADISTLSFDHRNGIDLSHNVTVTGKGAIILGGTYATASSALAVVLQVYEELVKEFCRAVPPRTQKALKAAAAGGFVLLPENRSDSA